MPTIPTYVSLVLTQASPNHPTTKVLTHLYLIFVKYYVQINLHDINVPVAVVD